MTQGHELFDVTPLPQALTALLARLALRPVATEDVTLDGALGRYLAHDVCSPENVPAFSRSTMDGFAVRAADTFGASESSPTYLIMAGEVQMGRAEGLATGSGEAIAIPTGGALPEGADAVVMVEHTAPVDAATIEVTRSVAPGENVVQAGEDIAAGRTLLTAGRRLRPQDLGALAAIGVTNVRVQQKVRVGILSTGNEIVEAAQQLMPGQMRDVNYYALAGLVRQSGAEPVPLGICPDEYQALHDRLTGAVAANDVVLVSGGSSVGAADLTPQVIAALGEPGILVHGVAAKPGKPTIIALAGQVPVFGLPGHPVSAMDMYRLLVAPLIDFMYTGLYAGQVQGSVTGAGDAVARSGHARLSLRARMARAVASASGREDRVRVSLEQRDNELWAHPILGRSGLISLMLGADAVAVIPFDAEGVARGDEVPIELL